MTLPILNLASRVMVAPSCPVPTIQTSSGAWMVALGAPGSSQYQAVAAVLGRSGLGANIR